MVYSVHDNIIPMPEVQSFGRKVFRNRVPAGWLSLLVNAGEGIDVDLFLYKQDKVKTIERIGRRIRLNRSKIKDASDNRCV